MDDKTELLPDGVYFNLPMEDYVAQPRLGAHAIGNLLVSAATFWNSSWLNPTPRKVSDAVQATRIAGAAHHTARLELEHFEARYVREMAKDDHPDALVTTDDLSAAIIEAGHAPVTRIDTGQTKPAPTLKEPDKVKAVTRAAKKEDLVNQLLGINPGALIWDAIVAAYMAEHEGKIPLSAQLWGEIIEDGERLRASPEVAGLLDGGFAEVSILWTDERGIPCKCRPDKLRADQWLDLKTYSNPQGKHLEQALSDAFKFNRYHVGATHYRDGIEMIRGANLQIVGDATDAQRELIARIQMAPEELACWYVFQERGGVPNILAKQCRFFEVPITTEINHAITDDEATKRRVEKATETPSLWWDRARKEIRKAKRLFRTYSEIYEPGQPWLPFAPLGEFSDLSFSAFWLDEEVGE